MSEEDGRTEEWSLGDQTGIEALRVKIAALEEGEELIVAAPVTSLEGELLGPVLIVVWRKEKRGEAWGTGFKIGYDARKAEPRPEHLRELLEIVKGVMGGVDEIGPTRERMREAGGGLG